MAEDTVVFPGSAKKISLMPYEERNCRMFLLEAVWTKAIIGLESKLNCLQAEVMKCDTDRGTCPTHSTIDLTDALIPIWEQLWSTAEPGGALLSPVEPR